MTTNNPNVRVKLEVFEGPLDLLLYLIKEEELNIADIPITRITEQYLEYLNLMELLDLDIAGEFLVVAATLMQIKSQMLLPPDPEAEAEEPDPRAELIRRLLEYKAYKEAAGRLKDFEENRSFLFTRVASEPELDSSDGTLIDVSLFDLLTAFGKVLKNLPKTAEHHLEKDEFTVAEKIHEIFHRLVKESVVRFGDLFRSSKNRFEVITAFLALLELIRLREIEISQSGHFGEIEISKKMKTG
ncbi:MAG: segregation/condensation protein A [Candidatus Omnitrophica bacterium]|nr:segregation/condensation protein A [Candidatus Omnitrophota bacterium]